MVLLEILDGTVDGRLRTIRIVVRGYTEGNKRKAGRQCSAMSKPSPLENQQNTAGICPEGTESPAIKPPKTSPFPDWLAQNPAFSAGDRV